MKHKRTYKIIKHDIDELGLLGIGKCKYLELMEAISIKDMGLSEKFNLIKDDAIICTDVKKYSDLNDGNVYIINFEDSIAIGKHLYIKNGLPYFNFGETGEAYAMPYPIEMICKPVAMCVKTREQEAYAI